MNVSVIIVNYNTSTLTLQCVQSLIEQTHGLEYEVIVVDNRSSSEQLVLLQNDSRFQLVSSPKNLGFGRANNLGATLAKGEYLFLLNPDTIVLNNAIFQLWNYMKHNPLCGIAGGNLYDESRKPTHSYHVWLPSTLSEIDFACGQLFRRTLYGRNAQFNYTDKPREVAMITGADLMIRRTLWDELNGFDDNFFMYYEDADLCMRVLQKKFKIMALPQSHIIHLEGKSFHETEDHCRRILQGRFLFFHKHHCYSYNLLADFFNILSINMAIFVYTICNNKTSKANMQIRLKVYKQLMSNTNK
ncbi:MAG: glycosyltransferase family 2 protein [Bacteroidales bacterium]|nr:glycosyltransferase family 2 protein [Bacteroidales bacterium]